MHRRPERRWCRSTGLEWQRPCNFNRRCASYRAHTQQQHPSSSHPCLHLDVTGDAVTAGTTAAEASSDRSAQSDHHGTHLFFRTRQSEIGSQRPRSSQFRCTCHKPHHLRLLCLHVTVWHYRRRFRLNCRGGRCAWKGRRKFRGHRCRGRGCLGVSCQNGQCTSARSWRRGDLRRERLRP